MSPEPEKAAAAPKSETAAVSKSGTAAVPAPVPVPFFGGKQAPRGPGPSGPGEPNTPMPDHSNPAPPRWLYALAAFLLALAAAAGTLFMREHAAAPGAQPPAAGAPVAPGPQAGN